MIACDSFAGRGFLQTFFLLVFALPTSFSLCFSCSCSPDPCSPSASSLSLQRWCLSSHVFSLFFLVLGDLLCLVLLFQRSLLHLLDGWLNCEPVALSFWGYPKPGVRICHSPGDALIGITVWISQMSKVVWCFCSHFDLCLSSLWGEVKAALLPQGRSLCS